MSETLNDDDGQEIESAKTMNYIIPIERSGSHGGWNYSNEIDQLS
jgi:hypothetical protein